jgi:hypothetical protein
MEKKEKIWQWVSALYLTFIPISQLNNILKFLGPFSLANVIIVKNQVLSMREPITVAARSKAWTVFSHSNTGIVGSNSTQGTDVCLRLFCVCVVLCVGSGLATGWSHIQGVLPTVYGIRNWKSCQSPTKGLQSHRLDTHRLCLWGKIFP